MMPTAKGMNIKLKAVVETMSKALVAWSTYHIDGLLCVSKYVSTAHAPSAAPQKHLLLMSLPPSSSAAHLNEHDLESHAAKERPA